MHCDYVALRHVRVPLHFGCARQGKKRPGSRFTNGWALRRALRDSIHKLCAFAVLPLMLLLLLLITLPPQLSHQITIFTEG